MPAAQSALPEHVAGGGGGGGGGDVPPVHIPPLQTWPVPQQVLLQHNWLQQSVLSPQL